MRWWCGVVVERSQALLELELHAESKRLTRHDARSCRCKSEGRAQLRLGRLRASAERLHWTERLRARRCAYRSQDLIAKCFFIRAETAQGRTTGRERHRKVHLGQRGRGSPESRARRPHALARRVIRAAEATWPSRRSGTSTSSSLLLIVRGPCVLILHRHSQLRCVSFLSTVITTTTIHRSHHSAASVARFLSPADVPLTPPSSLRTCHSN